MGFRLVSIAGRAALVSGDGYFDLPEISSGSLSADPMKAIAHPARLAALSSELAGKTPTGLVSEVTLGPPVVRPQKSFAVGLNFQAHAGEGGMEVPAAPLVFTKFPSCLVGPTADVELRSDFCDYEGELVVVITTTIDGIGTMTNRCVRVTNYQGEDS
jgi:2,4-diketo-3-deoxy-L-fuconate hydrolase